MNYHYLKRACRFLFAVIALVSVNSFGQIVPVGTFPTFYNGGFAGEAGAPRISSAFLLLNQGRPNNHTDFNSYLSVDHFFKKIRSGVALTYGNGVTTFPAFRNNLSLAVSPKFSVNGKFTLAPFVMIDYDKQRTPSAMGRQQEVQVKTGFLINSAKAYIGISARIVDKWKSSFYNDPQYNDSRVYFFDHMQYDLQAGYTFQSTPKSKFSFTPQLLINWTSYYNVFSQRINAISLTDLNLTFRYNKFIYGVNTTGLMVGFQTDRIKLQLTGLYASKGGYRTEKEISSHTVFRTDYLISSAKTYVGVLSFRYIIKK